MFDSSVLIQVILSILKALERWYKGSVGHRIIAAVGCGLRRICSGSYIKKTLLYSESTIEASVFFRILRWCFRLFNTLSHWVRINASNIIGGSQIFVLTADFQQAPSALRALGFSFIGFGLSLAILAILRHQPLAFIGLVFTLIGLLFTYFSGNLREKLKTSVVVLGVVSLIRLLLHDEEAEQCKDA